MKNASETWVALVCANQREGVTFLDDAAGGCVHVMASARNAKDFEQKVRKALDELGLDLVELDDSEPVARRMEREHLTEELSRMFKTAADIDSVAFGTFSVYSGHDGH